MASGLAKNLSKKFKPRVGIGISLDSPMMGTDVASPSKAPTDWRAEECKRLEAEAEALQKELDNHDDVAAGKKVKGALEIKLKLKKLRIQEHKLKSADRGGGYEFD